MDLAKWGQLVSLATSGAAEIQPACQRFWVRWLKKTKNLHDLNIRTHISSPQDGPCSASLCPWQPGVLGALVARLGARQRRRSDPLVAKDSLEGLAHPLVEYNRTLLGLWNNHIKILICWWGTLGLHKAFKYTNFPTSDIFISCFQKTKRTNTTDFGYLGLFWPGSFF